MSNVGRLNELLVEEREAIGLCIALEALNDIVNHALLTVRHASEVSGEVEIRFPTRIHQSMFSCKRTTSPTMELG